MTKEFKIEKGNWTTTFNDIFRSEINGKKLSPEAWGLYVFMLSLPETWDYTIMGLTKVVNAGKNKIQRMLKELQDAGFIKREQTHNGRFGKMNYTVLSRPEIQYPQNQHTEKQQTDNEPQQRTKELNPKELDKKKDKGENPPVFENHYLTEVLITKNIIDILDVDLENYNNMFKTFDYNFGYKNVLAATRYVVDRIVKLPKDKLNNKYEYLKSSLNNNLELLKNTKNENKPSWIAEYETEIQNMDADNEIDKLLNKHWNNTPTLN